MLLWSALSFASAPRGMLNVEVHSANAIRKAASGQGVKVSFQQLHPKGRIKKDFGCLLAFKKVELDGKWQKVEVSFTPEVDETLTLSVGAAFNGKNKSHPWLHIDKAQLAGAVLKNPGFENPDAKGVPQYWRGRGKNSAEKGALEGKNYARVNFQNPLFQDIAVKKGVKVTFSLYVRQENPLADNSKGVSGMTNIYTDCDGTSVHISSGRLTLIPSFENCSYYINRTPQEWGKECTAKVWYRKNGEKNWTAALDPVDMEQEKAWRGSLMMLQENTEYEFKALISGEKSSELRQVFRTRNSDFKVGRTIILDEKNFKGVLNGIVSGTPDGYTLYKAAPGFVLKGKKERSGGVIECINARYVIFDGLTINANGSRHGILLEKCSDMVIRNCNISNFGFFENVRDMKQLGRWTYKGKVMNYDSGVRIFDSKNTLVERCFIHSPNSTANSWFYSHPSGPSAICAAYAQGGTVIRYNDFVANDKRRWNDVVESNGNGLINGGFFRDSDIYGNFFAYGNDDGIELEGGEMNIRFYFNHIQGTLSGASTGSCRLGPSYQFRNVYCKSGDENNYKGAAFKNSHGNQGDGALFIINNTVYSPGGNGAHNSPHSMPPALSPKLKAFSRNNIMLTATDFFVAKGWRQLNADFDYDLLYNEDPEAQKAGIALNRELNQEKNAICADPRYRDPENGDFRLKETSPARNRAVNIPGLPVKHLGAFQDDGIDIPHRPFPVLLDKKEINFTPENKDELFKFTLSAAGKNYTGTFKVYCNDTFFSVTPAAGTVRSGEKITFTVKLKNKQIKAAKLHNGVAVIRFADGFSRVLSVYGDFRDDKLLKEANFKNIIPVSGLKKVKGGYSGTVTIPEKGCYFLFATGTFPGKMRTAATASIGGESGKSGTRFSEIRKGIALFNNGSLSGWYFFLDKGTYPFTFKAPGNTGTVKSFFVTCHPEEVLR